MQDQVVNSGTPKRKLWSTQIVKKYVEIKENIKIKGRER
jgi:hypothetical protein